MMRLGGPCFGVQTDDLLRASHMGALRGLSMSV